MALAVGTKWLHGPGLFPAVLSYKFHLLFYLSALSRYLTHIFLLSLRHGLVSGIYTAVATLMGCPVIELSSFYGPNKTCVYTLT
jgi:hypothetical protein